MAEQAFSIFYMSPPTSAGKMPCVGRNMLAHKWKRVCIFAAMHNAYTEPHTIPWFWAFMDGILQLLEKISTKKYWNVI